jgi:hypothetical protein
MSAILSSAANIAFEANKNRKGWADADKLLAVAPNFEIQSQHLSVETQETQIT